MENRTLKARIQCRTKDKEKELFFKLCKERGESVQDVLRDFILKYIKEHN